jgi:hypothetical protein
MDENSAVADVSLTEAEVSQLTAAAKAPAPQETSSKPKRT